MLKKEESYQLVVCGGGLAGFCAAVSAARNGVRTCLIHDRPVLGGNSSSEIRVTPLGAARFHAYARETGVISELLIEQLRHNHENMSGGGHNTVWDRTLYNMALSTPNLTLYMNTSVLAVHMDDERTIGGLTARVANSEIELVLKADMVADCTGDGVIADLAGCRWRMGTESREETGEPHAPLQASDDVMGSTIMFKAVDVGRPAPFVAPAWAAKYDDASFFYEKGHPIYSAKHGFWWVEISVPWHTIHENEEIRHQLTRHILGVWDWIKNKDPLWKDKAANMALDWVGQVPGKRESRRIIGKYWMTEHDMLDCKRHDDEAAFGGWYIDVHSPHGMLDPRKPELSYEPDDTDDRPSLVCGPYGIPLRALMAADVDNLFMAGRNISVTHIALGSVRVMETTAVMGQAVGTAAAVAVRRSLRPEHLHAADGAIGELQQQLLRDGCFLPNVVNEDPADLARLATASASSEALLEGVGPDSVGYVADLRSREKRVDEDRPLPGDTDELAQRRGQWIAVGEQGLERISVCLGNVGSERQYVRAELVEVDHIWDYRVQGGKVIAETVLEVDACERQWVEWTPSFGQGAAPAPGRYVRLDLLPNDQVIWHCAGAIQPGMMSAYDTGGQMRRYKYGRTLSFKVEPAQSCYTAGQVLSGVTRPHRYTNVWRSDPAAPLPQWLQLDWPTEQRISRIDVTFSGHLFREFEHAGEGAFYTDAQLVKDYKLLIFVQGQWQEILSVEDNYERRRVHAFDAPLCTDRIRLLALATNGDPSAAVYEIRCYS